MTTPTPDESAAAGAERPERESDRATTGDAAATGATGATGSTVTADAARPAAGTPDRLVKRGAAAPKPAQGDEAGAADAEDAAAAPRPPAAAPEEAPGAGAPAGTPATSQQPAGAADDAAPAAPAPQPPGAEAPAVNGGGLDLTRTPNTAPAAASLPPAPSVPPAAASLPATPPAPPSPLMPPTPVATVPATPPAPPAGPHNPWAAPSPAAGRPNPWAAPAPVATVPAAFGAPPQPGEQLPREPLSIAAIGAAGMLLSPVALGLSALALRRHRRRPARGRSLAVAAATIAVAQLGVAAVAVPVALSWDSGEQTAVAAERTTEVEPADDTPDDGKAPSKDDPEWQDWHDEPDPDLPTATGPVMSVMLAPGDCFRPYEDAAGESDDEEVEVVEMAELVACDTPHPAEAIGYVDLLTPGAEWPGQEKLNDLAFQACDAMIAPYVLDVWKLASPEGDLAVNAYLPLQESWEKTGHRGVVCFLESPEADDSLTSGLRGDPASYNQTQRHYLRLTQGMETAALSYPYNESPARVRDWADRIADEAEDQAVQLRGTVWDSPGAQAGALQLADARDAEAAHWREVAAAPDEATLEKRMEDTAAWDEALALEAEFRELVGLPTW